MTSQILQDAQVSPLYINSESSRASLFLRIPITVDDYLRKKLVNRP